MKLQPTSPTTIATACLRAADVLREKGWVQGRMMSRDGYCALGALRKAAATYELCADAADAMREHIGRQDIGGWNDAPERTREQVIAALEATAWANPTR